MARRRRTIRPKAPPRRAGAVSAGGGAARACASSLREMDPPACTAELASASCSSLRSRPRPPFRFRFSIKTASHRSQWLRTIGVSHGPACGTLQKGSGEGETEWSNASRNRRRPSLQSLPPEALPARLALALKVSHFRAFLPFRAVKIYSSPIATRGLGNRIRPTCASNPGRRKLIALALAAATLPLFGGSGAYASPPFSMRAAGRMMPSSGSCRASSRALEIYDSTATLQDRTVTTGYLAPTLARAFGAGGYVGRASGRAFDARKALRYAPYDQLKFEVPVRDDGDVNARLWIRAREVEQSLKLIEQILGRLSQGKIRTPVGKPVKASEGLGITEAFRGDVLVSVRLKDGAIERCHLRDPSWFQWPLLEVAVEGNIVADFPLCNKSFNCSYSGHDL